MRSLTDFEWKKFFLLFYERTFETGLFDRAAQVGFYFSFSLFPLLFFLVSLIGLVLGSADSLKKELFTYLGRVMPGSAYELVRTTVNEIASGSSSGKLTLGLLITLWSASAGVDSVRSALNAVYRLPETRIWYRLKVQSIALTFATVVLIGAVMGIFFYGWRIAQVSLGAAGLHIESQIVLASIQWIAVILVLLFGCELIYNLLPNFKRLVWIWITPGSVVAILLWIMLTSGFRLYLEFFDSYNRTYGSLGAVIILMLWLYLTSIALLIGGLINAILSEMTIPKRKPKQ